MVDHQPKAEDAHAEDWQRSRLRHGGNVCANLADVEKVVGGETDKLGAGDSLTVVVERVSFAEQAWVVGERGAKENVGAVLTEHLQEHAVEPRVGDGRSTIDGSAIDDFHVFQVVHFDQVGR